MVSVEGYVRDQTEGVVVICKRYDSSLKQYLNQRKTAKQNLTLGEILNIALAVAQGLEHLHKNALYHFDLKVPFHHFFYFQVEQCVDKNRTRENYKCGIVRLCICIPMVGINE